MKTVIDMSQKILARRLFGKYFYPSNRVESRSRLSVRYIPLFLAFRQARKTSVADLQSNRYISRDGKTVAVSSRFIFHLHLNKLLPGSLKYAAIAGGLIGGAKTLADGYLNKGMGNFNRKSNNPMYPGELSRIRHSSTAPLALQQSKYRNQEFSLQNLRVRSRVFKAVSAYDLTSPNKSNSSESRGHSIDDITKHVPVRRLFQNPATDNRVSEVSQAPAIQVNNKSDDTERSRSTMAPSADLTAQSETAFRNGVLFSNRRIIAVKPAGIGEVENAHGPMFNAFKTAARLWPHINLSHKSVNTVNYQTQSPLEMTKSFLTHQKATRNERQVAPVEIDYKKERQQFSTEDKPVNKSQAVNPVEAKVDVDKLTRDVMQQIEKRIRVERQRHGLL